MTSPDSTYQKPFLSLPEQIFRLRERGMDCGSDAFASETLERCGYYRLSGYWHPFRERPKPPYNQLDAEDREIRLDTFSAGTNLARVADLHDFDHELRMSLSSALSSIETSFRFVIGHRLGKMDVFAHRNPEVLDVMRTSERSRFARRWRALLRRHARPRRAPTAHYREWLKEYDRHETRARDIFVQHFRAKYGPHLPIWVATEVMSFGVLSQLYTLMPQREQEIIAARFQVHTADGRGDRGALGNWLNNLRNVRNICAHHGRVWNRTFDVLIDAPGQARKSTNGHLAALTEPQINNKLYGVLLVMRHLLLTVAPARTDVLEVVALIEARSQSIPFNLRQAGFPRNWKQDPIWETGFALPTESTLAGRLLDRTDCLTAGETRAVLSGADGTARAKLLKDYRRHHAAIEIALGGVIYFPTFQFRDGRIIEPLAEINHRLATACAGAHPLEVSAALLDWWQTPNPALPMGPGGVDRSPAELLSAVTEKAFEHAVTEADATKSFVAPDPGVA